MWYNNEVHLLGSVNLMHCITRKQKRYWVSAKLKMIIFRLCAFQDKEKFDQYTHDSMSVIQKSLASVLPCLGESSLLPHHLDWACYFPICNLINTRSSISTQTSLWRVNPSRSLRVALERHCNKNILWKSSLKLMEWFCSTLRQQHTLTYPINTLHFSISVSRYT